MQGVYGLHACVTQTVCVCKLQDTFWELVLSLYCELSGLNSGCQPCMTNTFLICCYCFQRNLFIYLFYILAIVSPPF